MPTSQPIQQVAPPSTRLPRVVIAFCTQCKWNLRAAYFAQELLSTFGNAIGEVALCPETGGVFTVHLTYIPQSSSASSSTPSSALSSTTVSKVVSSEESTLETSKSGVEAEEKEAITVLIWDRKSASGFPETKELKQRVRDCIAPKKDLGHSDVGGVVKKKMQQQQQQQQSQEQESDKQQQQQQQQQHGSQTEDERSAHVKQEKAVGVVTEKTSETTVECEDCR